MNRQALCGILMLATGVALADLTVVQKIESNVNSDKAAAISMTISIKGLQAKLEFKPQTHSSLIDLQAGKFYMINHSTKQVMVMPLAQMKAIMAMAGKALADKSDKTSLQKTGKTQNINGFQCFEYSDVPEDAAARRMTCWMAEDVDTQEMAPFLEFAMNSAKVMGLHSLGQLKGALIAAETETACQGGNSRSRLEVQSISRDAIDDAVFAMPTGYQVTELPVMLQLGPEKSTDPAQDANQ